MPDYYCCNSTEPIVHFCTQNLPSYNQIHPYPGAAHNIIQAGGKIQAARTSQLPLLHDRRNLTCPPPSYRASLFSLPSTPILTQRSATGTMDVVALRTGIQASLDANADTRRQAEIDLKTVGAQRSWLSYTSSTTHTSWSVLAFVIDSLDMTSS